MPMFRGSKWYLSNMYPYPMKVNGNLFSCVEAAFQSFKTTDLEERKKFIGLNGFQAKKLGRQIKLRDDWESIKVDCMHKLLQIKFRRELGEKLKLETDEDLVEENTWGDTYWGVCNGKGKNVLGRILQDVRDELKAKE